MERGRPAQGSAGCADISTAADVEDFVIATKKTPSLDNRD
jgi:hypothetical protein